MVAFQLQDHKLSPFPIHLTRLFRTLRTLSPAPPLQRFWKRSRMLTLALIISPVFRFHRSKRRRSRG